MNRGRYIRTRDGRVVNVERFDETLVYYRDDADGELYRVARGVFLRTYGHVQPDVAPATPVNVEDYTKVWLQRFTC